MISYLKGLVLKKTDKGIILDTGNIGYFVNLPKNLLGKVEEKNKVEFFTHHHVREDAMELYGFQSFEALSFFKKLITLKGIGPKVSLEILSAPEAKINEAIIKEDISFLTKIPGIGKKTAQRLILELKGEISNIDSKKLTPEIDHDATVALSKLGYQRSQINETLKRAPKSLKNSEDLIRYFLKNA